MAIDAWEHFFKPEVRSSGRALFAKGKVTVSQSSDNAVQVFIRASSACKVTFSSEAIDSSTVVADCNCPQGKKRQLCKHIWAGLLAVEEKKPDFLEGKTEFEVKSQAAHQPSEHRPSEKAAAHKVRQAEFRKEQYQRKKAQKKSTRHVESTHPLLPREVESALDYFLVNGFSLRETLSKEAVGLATKKLARVFHPDVGGSHDEILMLNQHSEVLKKHCDS